MGTVTQPIEWLHPNWISLELGTGYLDFKSPAGVRGLARDNGSSLELLAIISDKPGSGQFKQFIHDCQEVYGTIYVWLDWNPVLGGMLERYGFRRVEEMRQGEPLKGWRWDATK